MARFISNKQFEALAVKDTSPALKWKELPLNKIYRIEERKEVKVNDEPAVILSLVYKQGFNIKVWAPNRLREQLNTAYANVELSLYIRSKGEKECKTNAERWYYDYDIIEAE